MAFTSAIITCKHVQPWPKLKVGIGKNGKILKMEAL